MFLTKRKLLMAALSVFLAAAAIGACTGMGETGAWPR